MEITNIKSGNSIIRATTNTMQIISTVSSIVIMNTKMFSADIIIPTDSTITAKQTNIQTINISS